MNDGGPAFPIRASFGPNPDAAHFAGFGMSLRDWFAGQVMVGLTSAGAWRGAYTKVARAAYELADAMLEERDQEGSND